MFFFLIKIARNIFKICVFNVVIIITVGAQRKLIVKRWKWLLISWSKKKRKLFKKEFHDNKFDILTTSNKASIV